jgi:arylsulfatase A-like enzyme
MRKDYGEKDWRIYRWIYCRLTERVDRHIGRILAGLREAGLEKNTLVIFTSDHGNMDAAHKLASKELFYEEAVRVPLIVRQKGVTAGATNTTHLVSTGLDILPTLCDYAGTKPPAHVLGRSLRRMAEGRPAGEWRTCVASENGQCRMIRSARYKYTVYPRGDNREFLVDMLNDPGEMRNLANDRRFEEVLGRHRHLLREWVDTSSDTAGSKFVSNGR